MSATLHLASNPGDILQLKIALKHWGTPLFELAIKDALENLPTGTLPLHQATSQGGIVDDSDISASILGSEEYDDVIRVRVSVFFTELVAGCNCNDPPMEANGHCLLELLIEKTSAETCFLVVPD